MQETETDDNAAVESAHRLQAFADSLAERKREAVDFMRGTGIAQKWRDLEELYDGTDDANRKWEKPATMDGRLTKETANTSSRSNIFLNIFQPYVDMGAARACEILVPTNDKPFGLRPTPMQDVEKLGKHPEAGQQMLDNGRQQMTVADAVKTMLAEAKESADKAETRIWDWWTEWRWQSEGRKMIDMASKIGTSVLKGPFPKRFKGRKVLSEGGQIRIETVESIKPHSKVIHPKNFFPDPACGEDIHSGSYVWECDAITAKGLRELMGSVDKKGQPLYLDDQIRQCLIEGPGKKYLSGDVKDKSDKDKFEIWYYHGTADHENMKAAGCECDEAEVLDVVVFTVNDRVIKAKQNTLDSGQFPYDVMVWQHKPGTWTGIGVGHQVETPQRMLNAGARNLMDNAGMSSAPIIIFDDEIIEPADDGPMEIRPRLMLRKKASATMQKASDAITSITIPSLQVELMNIINFAMQMAEKVTGMAIQQQGQQGENEETAAGRQILQANAGALMRRICKIFDDRMAPHVARYYEWLLIYGEDPSEKGDFVIDVMGSTVMFERDAKNMLVAQMLDRAANPIYGLNPEKMAKEWLKGQGMDVERIEYTEEEKKQMAEQAAQQPKDPAIEVATIRAKSATEVQQIRSQEAAEKMRLDTDRDNLYEQTMAKREETLQGFKERELMLKREIELMKENGESARQIEELKAKLADSVMKLKMQEKLASIPPAGAPEVVKPASEPPQRAPDGQAFQQ